MMSNYNYQENLGLVEFLNHFRRTDIYFERQKSDKISAHLKVPKKYILHVIFNRYCKCIRLI